MRSRPITIVSTLFVIFLLTAVLAGFYLRSRAKPSANTLIQQAIQAMGGKEALQAQANNLVEITGQITFMGPRPTLNHPQVSSTTRPFQEWRQGRQFA